jgi:hypothetical protein
MRLLRQSSWLEFLWPDAREGCRTLRGDESKKKVSESYGDAIPFNEFLVIHSIYYAMRPLHIGEAFERTVFAAPDIFSKL